jgi:hypothetical protein
MLNKRGEMRQAKLGKARDSKKNITSQINHALAQGPPSPGRKPPMPLPTQYWMGITWFLPSHRLA